METVYSNPVIWDQFALLATRYDHTLFIAGSGSKVRAMVECKGHEASLRRWFPQFEKAELPASLNEDKLPVKELFPLSHPDQYRRLFKKWNIPALRGAGGNDEPIPDCTIEAAHHITGGRLRAMQRRERVSSLATLPRFDTAAFYVLDRLRELQHKHGWTSAFELVSVREAILQWLAEWRKASPHLAKHNETVDVNTLLDRSYLVMTDKGEFTFAVPDFYRLLSNIRPHVFISHAWCDRNHPMLLQLVKALGDKHVRAVIDIIHPDRENAMAECPLENWMQRQQVGHSHFIIVIMTEAYKERAGLEGSGVYTEVKLLNQGTDSAARILSVSLEDCSSKGPSTWKDGPLAILGSRPVRELKNTADIDAVAYHILNQSCYGATHEST